MSGDTKPPLGHTLRATATKKAIIDCSKAFLCYKRSLALRWIERRKRQSAYKNIGKLIDEETFDGVLARP